MRRMIEDYHEFVCRRASLMRYYFSLGSPEYSAFFIKEIAATCLFLASKTEENGKRLDDLVTVALAKLHSVNPNEVAGKYDKV